MDDIALREIALQITLMMPREDADIVAIRGYVTQLLAWRSEGRTIIPFDEGPEPARARQ